MIEASAWDLEMLWSDRVEVLEFCPAEGASLAYF
jgi:hypothetical protein